MARTLVTIVSLVSMIAMLRIVPVRGGNGDGDEWDRNSCVLFLSCMCLVFSVFAVFLAVYVRVGMMMTGTATVASC